MADTPLDRSELVSDVLAEFRAFLNDTLVAHHFAVIGLQHFSTYLRSMPTRPANPDPRIFFGPKPPDDPGGNWCVDTRRSQALQQMQTGANIEAKLSQQFVVSVFTAWEHEFRPRLATIHGCAPEAITAPLLGDFRRLRNHVVHHHGVATQQNTGKCQVIGRWFTVGEPLVLSLSQLSELWRMFPWLDLAKARP